VSTLAAAAALVVLAALALVAFGPTLAAAWRDRRARPSPAARAPAWDPGRELRAERRARELLRSVVSADDYAMYAELGFLVVAGGGGEAGYGYLVYPHRPIVAFDTETGELLSEYCVEFADDTEPLLGTRLPDADDVLAKWMALRGGERRLISIANMHVPGWQVDPAQVRRDLRRWRHWRAARAREGGALAGEPA